MGRVKGTVFYFTRTRTLVIHSLISENPVFFFISRGKVHRSFNQILMKFHFFNKSCLCFFSFFVCVFFLFFFLFHGKVQRSFIHSIFEAEKKQTGKKKPLFQSFIRYSSKMHKNELFTVKKNTIPSPW